MPVADPVVEAMVETELLMRNKLREVMRSKLLPHQIRPPGVWDTWLIIAGRGAGKTFTGAYTVAEECRLQGAAARPIIVAPTISDAQHTCIEGPSGLWTLYRQEFKYYNRTKLILEHNSGAIVRAFGAEKPDRLRGPESSLLWIDETAIIDLETIEMALLGLRVGDDPRVIMTTTPRPTAFIKATIADPGTVISRATTFDNPNLSKKAQNRFTQKYDGTRLGRQELLGELLEEAEGALWKMATIEENRITPAQLPEIEHTVVTIDPATTATKKSDFTGLSVASIGVDGIYYQRFSLGLKVSPSVWAKRAIDLYREYDADVIVAEKNQGGDMVEETLRAEWADAPVKLIHASKGKRVRAEPVALLAEQGRVKYVGAQPSLEDQLINFGYTVEPENDDELDAHVYAVTELMGEGEGEFLFAILGE